MATSHTPLELLVAWVRRQVPPEPWEWFEGRRAALAGDASERDLLIALGFVPRRLGKADLALEADDLAAADAARPGWDPRGWSMDEAARLALLLASFDGDEAVFAARIELLMPDRRYRRARHLLPRPTALPRAGSSRRPGA